VLSLALPTLLVLDNFEHVVAAVSDAIQLISASDQLKVIVTSRAALRAYGEYEYPVPPLALPDRTMASAGILASSPAVALFLERAPAFQIGGAKKMEESQVRLVAEICARSTRPMSNWICSWKNPALAGSIMRRTAVILFAGIPKRRACSAMRSSLGAQ
jgi:predicted ATPase